MNATVEKKTAKAMKLPSKTFVNLAQKESRKKNVLTIAVGAAAILSIVAFTGKMKEK